MARKFYTLDVFTDQKLAGNPLAVVLDSNGLDDAAMQDIAVEFNLSETVFVSPPKVPSNGVAIRIFTPAHELPFAGHPTVGTAILLNHLNHLGVKDEFILEEQVGPVNCVVSSQDGKMFARFELPKISEPSENAFDLDLVCDALGLVREDLLGHGPEVWHGGVGYTMVPVNSLDAVRKAVASADGLNKAMPFSEFRTTNPYVFCKGGKADDADFHARMFAPNFGIPEDPATGSAVASMSGWIARHEMAENESRSFKIEQGYEMGRPSQIYLDIEKADGVIVHAGISGSAVIVSDGVLHI